MQRLFIDYIPEDIIILDEEQSRHISKSLRMKIGDMLMVTDGQGTDYGCQIETISSTTVTLKICYTQASSTEPNCKVTIYQGVPKSTKFEDIVQKSVELGVYRIIPTLTKRCISRPDEKSANKKNQRYNKIALEAAQQSGRGIVPEISSMTSLKEAIKSDTNSKKIVFYEGGGKPINEIIDSNCEEVSIYIGPEGGFDKEEIELLSEYGVQIATLGPRILRTQTAPVAALSIIMYITNNMN